jgi:uncharacterized membrane protein
MQELEADWGRVLSVWWLIHWRTLVGSFVTGAVIGGVLGVVAAFTDWRTTQAAQILIGVVVGIAWTILTTRMALRKRYRGFRIVLLPLENA